MARRHPLATAALVAAAAVTSCSHATAPPKPKIALVSDAAGFASGSRNTLARTGLERCAAVSGAETSVIESKSAADYPVNLNLLGSEGFDTIEAVGPDIAGDVAAAARHFPEVHFALIAASAAQPNVESVGFRDQEGGFIAGAIAGLASHTNHVALDGGVQAAIAPSLVAGFRAGVRQVAPAATVDVAYAGSFTDPAAARRIAARQLAAGADVLFIVAGPAGSGAFAAVNADRAARAIGVDVDQSALAPGRVLASVVDEIDVAAAHACLDSVSGKPVSGPSLLGVADGAIAISNPYRTAQALGPAKMAQLVRIERAIVHGTLVPPSNAVALAAFKPVPLR